MAVDYRKPGAFTMIGGFNISNNDPVDSRAYVADINHIYDDANWADVKPYPGLIVSAPDGQVRICVNSDYTKEDSWLEIGSNGTEVVADYSEALAAAKSGDIKVGQLVYASNEIEIGEVPYSAGLYVVTAVGESASLQKLGTTSASGDIESDVAALQTQVGGISTKVSTIEGNISTIEGNISTIEGNISTIEGNISTIEGNISTIEGNISTIEGNISTIEGNVETLTAKVDTIEEGAQVNVIEVVKVNGEALAIEDKAVNIEIPEVVYDAIAIDENGEISASTQATAPSTSSTLTVLNKLREDIAAIPHFRIAVVSEANEDGTPKVDGGISTTTVYLLKNTEETSNQLYTEWIYVNNGWEKLGEATIDLAPYAKLSDLNDAKEEINGVIATLAKESDLNAAISRIETLESEVEGIKSTIETLATKEEVEGHITGINETIATLATKEEVEGSIDTVNGRINAANGEIDNINNTILTLATKESVESLNGQVSSLVGHVNTANGKIDNINNIIPTLATKEEVEGLGEAVIKGITLNDEEVEVVDNIAKIVIESIDIADINDLV